MKLYETMSLSTRGRVFLYQPSRYEGGNTDHITLQKMDESSSLACFPLRLGAQQREFVSYPIRSLAQAYIYYSQCTPFAVCHAGQMVEYLMIIYDYDEEVYFTWHPMTDAQRQGRDCGRVATEATLAYVRSKPFGASDLVRLTVSPENTVACHLYQILYFPPTGRVGGDEIELGRVPY